MTWLKNTIMIVTAALPLSLISVNSYIKINSPDSYTMGIGVANLLFLSMQIFLSAVSTVAYEAIALAFLSLALMVGIGISL